VMVGALDGKLYAFHGGDGSDVGGWPRQLSHAIHSSPSGADIDGNGSPEIFTGVGVADRAFPPGAAYSLAANGGVRWRYAGNDGQNTEQAVQATLPIGDTNSDSVPDVMFGTMGLTAHSLRATDGGENPGWPYYWDDSVFSSAALADLNGDGATDYVVGGDSSPGGPTDHEGGMVRAINGNGGLMWEFRTNEIVYSSPAVGDVDGDGGIEVVVGGGDYYSRVTGTRRSDASKVFVLNAAGGLEWSRDIGAETNSSPALADVNGDGRIDIVQAGRDGNAGQVVAFNGNGAELWRTGNPIGGAVLGSVTTADLNRDGAQDVIVPTGGAVSAYDGRNGARMWAINQGGAAYQNSVLATDVDGDGAVDLFLAGSRTDGTGVVERWEVPDSTLGNLGWHTFRKDARRTGSWTTAPLARNLCTTPGGYWLVARDGGVFAFCDARFHGSTGAIRLNQPVVGMASTASGGGYWLVAADGGIFAFGDARFHGSTGAIRLNQPIVGMARTPSGNGYWLVASDGGIFAFGDAKFHGSTGAITLNQPVVGMAPTQSGNGYWLVARDGGIFAFGDAKFHGSTGAIRLNQPVVGMAAHGNGTGYWLTAADGGIFAFGSAPFRGSTGAIKLNQPIVGMAPTPSGDGYRLVASDGGVFSFNAPFFGSTGAIKLNQPIVGMATPGL
ncbi:MAG: VCBS repeat-containing protein, partial [Actinomycetota bacterium]|nr:VCBS repeat-containing protein [Actinomycetota bacterium]